MNDSMLFMKDVERIKTQAPLVHNITNFVVMNNTANALLALGASPVMAHAREEAADMAGIASALVLNIGTLNPDWVEAMNLAGQAAYAKQTPIVLDPVGAGATPYRTQVCKELIAVCKPTIIRANASEIRALVDDDIQTKGVDSTSSSHAAVDAAKQLALQTGAVVSISGEVDYVTDGKQLNEVRGGSALMPRVTGMGCTATAITAAFAAVNSDQLAAATHAMQLMKWVGERAAQEAKGPGSFQLHFIDELYLIETEAPSK